MKISRRSLHQDSTLAPLAGLNPLLQRIYAYRGITDSQQLERGLSAILSPSGLKGMDEAVALLYSKLQHQQKIIVVGDFDADGASSTALTVLGLRALGAQNVSYLVPDRFKFGYGLSPAIVAEAAKRSPSLIITVDNGISSIEGIEAALQSGIQVLITDHHLAGEHLPAATAIVNPNQPGCSFASKNLAGVGVVFYLLIALRAHLRAVDWFVQQAITEPNLADYLDLVALGTIADVVPLDQNNRMLVHQGIQRIRAERCRPGIRALLAIGKRDPEHIVASDLGFVVGPRLNAAGRLDDMSLGIECLLTDDVQRAVKLAQELDTLNQERRLIEGEMKETALDVVKQISQQLEGHVPWGLALYDPSWHQGVVGIVAARVKEKYHRPVIAFAPATANDHLEHSDQDFELKGSARSITGLHIRDVLEAMATQYPDLILKFGGHAMAAGLSIQAKNFDRFARLFDQQVCKQLGTVAPQGELFSDGELDPHEISLDNAELLRLHGPWGQGFPEPQFDGQFEVLQQRLLADKHLKLVLLHPVTRSQIDAIAFNVDRQQWPTQEKYVHAVYRLDVNDYRGQRTVQLVIEALQALATL